MLLLSINSTDRRSGLVVGRKGKWLERQGKGPQGEWLYPKGPKGEKVSRLGFKMLSWFQRRKQPTAAAPATPAPDPVAVGFLRPEAGATLLATPRRQRLLAHIWQRTSLSRSQFATLYQTPIERYAELVQQFPASESHHHAYPGGMLDHGLEIVAYALKLRQSQLMPSDATPEEQAAQSEAWTAGVAYAALLHDGGKIAVDLHVELTSGEVWHPWHGPLRQPYRFRYRKDRQYRLHSAAAGLVVDLVLDHGIFDWLSGYPDLWASLLYVLAGQYEHAGPLGELVVRADRASVAQALGGDPAKALAAAPRDSLQRKLLEGLRYLLKNKLKLNQPGPSDGWLTQDSLWLVSKIASDQLRAHLLSQGVDGIPSNNTALFNVLQEHGLARATLDGKAIWTATVASDAGWSHGFTFLRLAPALIWETGERPPAFAGTVEPQAEMAPATPPSEGAGATPDGAEAASSARPMDEAVPNDDSGAVPDAMGDLLDLLQPEVAPSQAQEAEVPARAPAAQDDGAAEFARSDAVGVGQTTIGDEGEFFGEHFVGWLRTSIEQRKLIINDVRALVHTVAETVYLVTPGLFTRYAQEHPQLRALAKRDGVPEWEWAQKRFQRLGLHRKQVNGLNIWTCEVNGPRKSRRLHGYLLQSPTLVFNDLPPNNPYLSVVE